MDKNLHTTIDYKKLIELQANEIVTRMEKDSKINNQKLSSKGKVKTIGRRTTYDKRK